MRKLKLGVIGVGRFGQFHCEKYKSLSAHELVGVYDCSDLVSRQIAMKYGCKDFHSSDALLDCVDAVSIVTPTVTHFEYTHKALMRGVHCFVEKPIAATFAEGVQLVEEAKENGVVLQVGHIERFNDALVSCRHSIREPVYISAVRTCDNGGRCRDVDVVVDLMLHDIDVIMSLLGDYDSIEAKGDPDRAVAWMQFPDGVMAKFVADRDNSADVRRTFFDFEDREPILIDYHRKGNDALMDEVNDFIRSIKSGSRPKVSGADGLRALTAALEIGEGVKNGGPLRLHTCREDGDKL